MGVTNIDVTFLCLVNKKFTYHYFKYSKYVINWFYLLYFISESNLARAAGNPFLVLYIVPIYMNKDTDYS